MESTVKMIHRMIKALSLEDMHDLAAWLQAEIMLKSLEDDIPVKDGREVVETVRGGGKTYRLERVKCGKDNCRCAGGDLHGPYWYAYYRVGGRLKSEYIGKQIPPQVEQELRGKPADQVLRRLGASELPGMAANDTSSMAEVLQAEGWSFVRGADGIGGFWAHDESGSMVNNGGGVFLTLAIATEQAYHSDTRKMLRGTA